MNLCVLYTSSYARDDNPRERFIYSCARYNNPCARYNNPFARYNNPCARYNKLSARFNHSCKRNKNPCARYNKPYARDNNPFSRYNYLSAQLNNLRELIGVLVWFNNQGAKRSCIVFMSFCINVCLVETGKAPCWHTRIQVRQITIFVEGHQKQFLPERLWTLINNWLVWAIWRPTGVQSDKVGKKTKIRSWYTMLHDIAQFNV